MTSYSTYATGRLRLVDGTLTNSDDEQRADETHAVEQAIASGMCRALLDCARNDNPDDEDEIDATQWHSADEGWELEALTEQARAIVEATAQKFVRDNLDDILWLAERIAWDHRYKGETFAGDTGMGIYRVGMLIAYELAHQGIGFDDYGQSDDSSVYGSRLTGRTYRGITGKLSLWVDENEVAAYEDGWVDTTEEPCLLHLG